MNHCTLSRGNIFCLNFNGMSTVNMIIRLHHNRTDKNILLLISNVSDSVYIKRFGIN